MSNFNYFKTSYEEMKKTTSKETIDKTGVPITKLKSPCQEDNEIVLTIPPSPSSNNSFPDEIFIEIPDNACSFPTHPNPNELLYTNFNYNHAPRNRPNRTFSVRPSATTTEKILFYVSFILFFLSSG